MHWMLVGQPTGAVSMNITPEDAKTFPELAALIRHLPRIVASKPKVMAAFRRYAGDGADLALLFGQLPRVRVDLDYFRCEGDGDPRYQGNVLIQARTMKMGFTPPSPKVGEIYVASDIAINADDRDGALVAEATLLHECVHWCRMMDDKDVWSEAEPYAFEKEAYGRVIGRTYQMCFPQRVTK
jgi:hypothetical protein